MVNRLHRDLQVRRGGATRAEVEEMLRDVDADRDGAVSERELADLAKRGREKGFASEDSLELFRAGLDAGGLAEVKSREPGQQITPDYLDRTMTPFLEKSYGRSGKKAAMIVAPQASAELTADSARLFEARSRFDTHTRGAIRGTLPSSHLYDANGNARVDAGDRELIENGGKGFRWAPIGQARADEINSRAGLARGAEMLDGPPAFPNGAEEWTHKDRMSGWLDGPWELKKITEGGGRGFHEFELDTSKMKPSEALDRILDHPRKNCMDCAMAKQVVQYQRVRQALGDEEFDRLATKHGMVIGHSDAAYRRGFLAEMTAPVEGAASTPLTEYNPGWQGYAKITTRDPKAMERLEAAGFSGEHFTVALNDKGEKVALAHPFGSIPLADFDRELRAKVAATAGIDERDIDIEYRPPIDVDLDYARKNL